MVKVLMRKVSQKSCQRNFQVIGGGPSCSIGETDGEDKEMELLKN